MPAGSRIGVDGCRGGWIAAVLDPRGSVGLRLFERFGPLLDEHPEATIAVDMPVGLPEDAEPGGRACDRAARRHLGRPRASSVFSPPTRDLLPARSYDRVRGRGLTIQAFNLLPRIREIDGLMTPALQGRVIEAHPELAFATLSGHAVASPKRTAAGRALRLAILRAAGAPGRRLAAAVEQAAGRWPRRLVQPDDLVDAAVLALVARRHARGEARRLPDDPPRDGRGLRMEIWC